MLTEEDQMIETWKEYVQNDQQNIAPLGCYEMENQDFLE